MFYEQIQYIKDNFNLSERYICIAQMISLEETDKYVEHLLSWLMALWVNLLGTMVNLHVYRDIYIFFIHLHTKIYTKIYASLKTSFLGIKKIDLFL